eukprot:jgi/Tetstr1/440607/TSEL_028918.t1
MSDTPGQAAAKLPREMREKIRDYDGFRKRGYGTSAGEYAGEVPDDNNLIVFDIEPAAAVVSFRSQGLLRNLRHAELPDLHATLVAASTHKIHYGTWMLLTVGTYSAEYDPDKKKLVHRFRPIISFAFAGSESEASVSFLFTSTFAAHRRIYGSVPVVKCIVSDKGTGIRAAIRSTLTDAQRVHDASRRGTEYRHSSRA